MKIFKGNVVSTRMAKTASVKITRVVTHPVYGKKVRKNKRYHVHDELGAKVGDRVHFVASRPYSKLKKWKIIKIEK